MDLKNQAQIKYLQYFFLALVLIFQEKNPWDEFNSGIPIIVSFVLLFSNYIRHGKFPSYDYQPMRRGLMLLAFGVGCFIRGLDDDNDPFRFFHGCWHAFVGASAYYNFKVLPMVQSHRRRNSPRSHLPIKKI
jgi:predicted membrane channel-forming protein YqfA (hemolysin III family)